MRVFVIAGILVRLTVAAYACDGTKQGCIIEPLEIKWYALRDSCPLENKGSNKPNPCVKRMQGIENRLHHYGFCLSSDEDAKWQKCAGRME